MNKLIEAKPCSNMTLTEISIVTERLYYLLQTITEGHDSMEDKQRFHLLEVAWNISAQINSWMWAEENREN